MKLVSSRLVLPAALVLVVTAVAAPVAAQRDFEPLFDKFNLRLEGSWVGLSTEIRLDSEVLGTGTTLSFEDDLDLDASKTVPSLAFEWQIARRHRLGVRWQDINRDSVSQTLEEIKWGDEVIPLDAEVRLGFDVTQYYIDYTYFPWVKERWAAGFGLGLRVLELSVTLDWTLEGGEEQGEGTSDVKGTGPLPYLYFEYRRMFSEHWRFQAGVGWLYVSIEDISGGQWVGRLGIEYLIGDHFSVGGAFNLSTIDVDWDGIETEEDGTLLNAAISYDINDFSVFLRARF